MRKPQRKTISPEEQEEQNFQRSIAELREQPIHNPTVKYEIGEDVKFGGFTRSKVIDILDNGEIYILHCESDKTQHRKSNTETCKRVCAWFDVFKKNEDFANVPIISKRDDMQINYFQQDIGSLLNRYYFLGIIMNPDYQRDLVWNEDQEQSLLHSIFNNIDIGKFAFISLPSVGDEYYIPSTKKKPDDALNGLTKLGRLLYKLKGMNDKKKVRILHPIGFIVFILMMIAAIPLCLFKPFTIFDILDEFTLI
jgi:hypothetical protein